MRRPKLPPLPLLDYPKILIAASIPGIFLVLASYGGYQYWTLSQQHLALEREAARLEWSLSTTHEHFLREQEESNNLAELLGGEQAKNQLFASQIQSIAGTVGTLKKLSETDKELLNKYSKVYFLSENYVPSALVNIQPQYLFDQKKSLQIHTNVAPFLERMMNAMIQSSGTPKVVSAYRSFNEQAAIKTGYKVLYGSGTANQFSAEQGYSEHQLGTTVDFTNMKISGLSLSFEKSPEYVWLEKNAHAFGFVLSYPKNNAFYQFEPWHWRFVGVKLATRLHDEKKYFYDLSQREIDQYLVSVFD